MEGLTVGSVTDILQLVAIVGGIAIFWWKVPSRREMEKADDILRASIVALTARVDAGFDRTSEKFDRISEKFDRLSDKMDANAQTFHADIIDIFPKWIRVVTAILEIRITTPFGNLLRNIAS